MLTDAQMKEVDLLAQEIANLANTQSQIVLESDVSLDLTINGWVATIETNGKLLYSGKPTKIGYREALASLKENIKKEENK